MFAQLGEHKFEGAKAPMSMNDSSSVKVGRISLINGKDAVQFGGEELDEMQLSVQYAVPYCTPAAEIDALKTSMRTGEVLPLIFGDGAVAGRYIITSVEVNRQSMAADGQLLAADVSISLLEYPGEEEAEPRGLAVVPAAGESGTVPTAEPPIDPEPSPANAIASDVSQATGRVSRIKRVWTDVKKGTTSFRAGVREIRQTADDARQLYETAATKIEATNKIIRRAADLPGSLGDAVRYAANLANMDYSVDFTAVEQVVGQLSASADKVTDRMGPVVAFSASREGGI